MRKPRRKWPDHPLVGRKVTYTVAGKSKPAEIVDVKPGPMMVDTSTFDQPEAKIFGTVMLRLKDSDSGAEFWSGPVNWNGKEENKQQTEGQPGKVGQGCDA